MLPVIDPAVLKMVSLPVVAMILPFIVPLLTTPIDLVPVDLIADVPPLIFPALLIVRVEAKEIGLFMDDSIATL